MKNGIKLIAAIRSIAIIAIAAVIGFSFAGCDDSGDNNNGGATWANGTWNKSPLQLEISGNNFLIKNYSVDAYKGTLTLTGTETAGTITINVTHVNQSSGWQAVEVAFNDNGIYTATANTLTLSGLTVDGIALANGVWTKQGSEHTHSYSTTWSKDATQHWRECSCGSKTEQAAHNGSPCNPCGYPSGSNTTWADGTWNKSPLQLIVSGNNFTIKNNSVDAYKGTLTFTGTETAGTIAINITHINQAEGWQEVGMPFSDNGTYTATTNTLTISALTVDGIALANGAWTKQSGSTVWECACNTCETNCDCIKAECDPVCTCDCDDQGSNPNPITWTGVTNSGFGNDPSANNDNINSIAWGNGKFIAGSLGYPLATSTNGTAWTPVTGTTDDEWDLLYSIVRKSGIVWGKDKYVIVTNNATIFYSSNGTTWEKVEDTAFDYSGSSSSYGIMDVAWGGAAGQEKFVAVGDQGKMAYSSNGINWTPVTDSKFDTRIIRKVVWGNDKFVAVGGVGKMSYSSDGINWEAVADSKMNANYPIYSIAYGNGKFIAAGGNNSNAIMAFSMDGINWTPVTNVPFTSGIINGIAYGNNKFVAVGQNGKAAFSSDCITWTQVTNTTFDTTHIQCIAWGNNKFVAGGPGGKMAYWDGN